MTYDDFCSRLENADAFERLMVLESISYEADEDTMARAASRVFADEDPGVREQAGRLLAALATKKAAAMTVPFIASSNIAVRNLAGEVLVEIGRPSVLALAPAIDDADHDVRKFAIDVLAQLPAQDQAARIAARLDDPDDNVVLASIDAIGDLRAIEHRDDLHVLYERLPLARPGIVTALGVFGETADLGLLERALGDEDPVVQYSAAEALTQQDAPEVMELLLRMVNQVDPMARPVVLSSIVGYYETQAASGATLPASLKGALLEMLDDFDLVYRCSAVRGLVCFLDDEMVSHLMSRAGQDDTLDLEMFKALAFYPDAFRHIVANVEAGHVSALHAAGFVLGFLGLQLIPEDDYSDVAHFFECHFEALNTEVKIAALSLIQSLQHPALDGIIRAGLADFDFEVSSFAADVACSGGLDAGQGA